MGLCESREVRERRRQSIRLGERPKVLENHDEAHTENVTYKVLLIGDSAVGKSSILRLAMGEKPIPVSHMATVGVDFSQICVPPSDLRRRPTDLVVWDTAGQERYRSITTSYYRGAHFVIVVFDLTSRSSHASIVRWLSDVKKLAHPKIGILLVGNKCDLIGQRVISEEDAKNYAKEIGIPYMETSARDGLRVDELFRNVADLLVAT